MFESRLEPAIAARAAYTRAELLQAMGGACCQLSPAAIDSVRSLGLQRRRRGTRAGRNYQRPIHIVNIQRSRDRRRHVYKQTRTTNLLDRSADVRPLNLIKIRRAALTAPVNIGLFNACSVHNKSASVCDWITSSNVRLAAVVETWHDSQDCPDLIACTPPGFHFIERARPRPPDSDTSELVNHGGVCLFYHNSLHAKRISFVDYETFEFVAVYITGSSLTVLMIVVYRPGSKATSSLFFEEFSDLLERSSVYASSLIIIGDLNIHLDIATDPSTVKFRDILDSQGLVQHVAGATHRAGHCLDVIITRQELCVRSVSVKPPMLSDHCTIIARLDLLVPQDHSNVRRVRRSWRQFDFDSFIDDLRRSTLVCDSAADNNVDDLFDRYDQTMRSLLEVHAPTRTVCVRVARSAPWYDADCRAARKLTRRLEKTYRRSKSTADRLLWSDQFSQQRLLFQQKLRNYWLTTIDSCGNDSRLLWSKMRNLMSPPPHQLSCRLSADDFATHFSSKVDKIRASTSDAPAPIINTRHAASLSSFAPVTVDEITRLLSRMPAKHCQLDPVPSWLVKRAADVLAPVFVVMCNASMCSGKFPDSQKHAVVFPRLKKSTLVADDVNSYRPISNLSFASKLVERVIASRFTAHAENNKLFPIRQSAYRRHHSTESAVVSVMNDIIRAIDNGEVAAMVLLDLSAAFDTVDHKTLMDVMQQRFAISNIPLMWFSSYLTNRTQSVSVNGIQSAQNQVVCSVPQGSVLGPLEFITYTDDVVEIFCRHCVRYHLFADDKQVYTATTISDINSARQRLCSCIVDTRDWCSSRRLQLNASKTELMWFGSRASLLKMSAVDLTLMVGDDVIKPSTVIRDLGVYLDAELTMKQHVNRTASSCFFHIRRLRQIRRSVGPEVTKKLVSAFILSRLDYCNAALAGLPQNTLKPLQRAQNAAARLITGIKQHDHITESMKNLHWLPIKFRIQYKLCLIMHMIITKQCPDYMSELVSLTADNATRAGLRSASGRSFKKPKTRTKFGERAFSYSGPAAWNLLPDYLHSNSNTASFKRQLKTYLFAAAY